MSEPAEHPIPEDQADTPSVPPQPSVWQRRLRLLSHFFAGQTIVQGLNFLVGFLLLRWMSEEVFAQYTVAWSFQSTVGSLVDLGFAGSIVALVGDRGNDPSVVGRYIRSARHYRFRSFFVVMLVATIAYPLVVKNQPWGWQIKSLLYVGIVGGVAAMGLSMYSSALLISRQLKPYYRAQIISGLWRQFAYIVMWLTHTLTSWASSWVSVAAIAIYGFLYRKAAKPHIKEPEHADSETNRQMSKYLAPLMPGIVFAAFQNHISVGIITLLGATQNIAEVGALGRLTQLFVMLSTFNAVIVEPYIARVSRDLLLKRYMQVVAGQIAIGVGLAAFAMIFPDPLLWLIGKKYYHLRPEVVWVAMTAGITYLCGGMWTMNSARRWVFWWGTILYITIIIATQVACALTLDLSTTHGVVLFNVATASSILIVHVATAVYGFRYGARVEGVSA